MKSENTPYKCPNCNYLQNEEKKYCPHCGQRIIKTIPKLKDLLEDVLSMIFNFDAKIYQTLQKSLIPGRLTKDFFDGKRSRYYLPFRFFFITSILFFWVMSMNEVQDIITFSDTDKVEHIMNVADTKLQLDSMRVKITNEFENKKLADAVFDSIQNELLNNLPDSLSILNFSDKKIKLSTLEFMGMTADQVIDKYQINKTLQKVAITQFFKVGKDSDKFGWYLTSKLIWVLAFLLPIFALFMKLLFFKSKRFYIEHLVFLLYTHGFLFLLGSMVLFISLLVESDIFTIVSLVGMIAYTIIALKQYYQQNWLKQLINL